jgi:hypothetical protein
VSFRGAAVKERIKFEILVLAFAVFAGSVVIGNSIIKADRYSLVRTDRVVLVDKQTGQLFTPISPKELRDTDMEELNKNILEWVPVAPPINRKK